MKFDYMAHLGDTAYLQRQINDNAEIVIPRVVTDAPMAIKLHGNPANFVYEDIDNKNGEILGRI
ncbi:MAG: hypothetical protein E7632_02705 [Ruminococcaceae bacterium]|nr:hypothetical protein [Oscillospiraceae bacterium]